MIKVINVISDLNIGGAGKCILTFLKHYNKDVFETIVVVPKGSLLINYIKNLNARYIEVDGLKDKSLDLKSILKLKDIFKNEKPDIIHAHAAMSAKIAGRLYKKAKIIYTRHSVFEPPKLISTGLGKAINGAVNNFFADKIIAVADAAKDNLTTTGVSEKKIIVIKNGVDKLKEYSSEKREQLRSEYKILNNEFLMGIAARLTEVKGHIYILDALELLLEKHDNIKLLIAGTGPYEDIIKSYIEKKGLQNNVIMAGFVEDIEKIMNILDLNLNASFGTEATSLSLLEGMSIGLPAVVSDFGGNPGVIKDGVNGFLFPLKNSKILSEKIDKLLSDKKLYDDLKKGSIKTFNEEFSADINTSRIEKVYLDVLNKGALAYEKI